MDGSKTTPIDADGRGRAPSLTEFLTARIDEDEAVARLTAERMRHTPPRGIGGIGDLGVVGYPFARVLAECEAKRGAIEAAWADHCQIESEWGTGKGRAQMEAAGDYPEVVQHLALPYADHPDYQPEWRP